MGKLWNLNWRIYILILEYWFIVNENGSFIFFSLIKMVFYKDFEILLIFFILCKLEVNEYGNY